MIAILSCDAAVKVFTNQGKVVLIAVSVFAFAACFIIGYYRRNISLAIIRFKNRKW